MAPQIEIIEAGAYTQSVASAPGHAAGAAKSPKVASAMISRSGTGQRGHCLCFRVTRYGARFDDEPSAVPHKDAGLPAHSRRRRGYHYFCRAFAFVSAATSFEVTAVLKMRKFLNSRKSQSEDECA